MERLCVSTTRATRFVLIGLLLIGSITLCGNGCPVATKPIEPAPGRGTIVIDPQPSGIQAPWLMFRADLREERWEGIGPDTLRSMRQGRYTVYWDDVEGYNIYGMTLDSGNLYDDETITFEVLYEPPRKDIVIEIVPSGLEPRWELEVPSDTDVWGTGDEVVTLMPPGDYTIRWEDEPGYVTPPDSTATHGYESDLVFVGVYVPE